MIRVQSSKGIVVALLGTAALALAACSSAGNTSAASTSSGGIKTITVGIIGSLTGGQSSTFQNLPKDSEDRLNEANEAHEIPGVQIKYVVVDNQSTPQGELSAAQDLVENKHVSAIITDDALAFAATSYLAKTGIPVVAPGFDGPEYGVSSNRNLFSQIGSNDPGNHSLTTWGKLFQSQGVTKLAIVGYGDSPSSSATTKDFEESAKPVGISVPYFTLAPTFGDTNMTQIAIAIKNSGANGVATELETNTEEALYVALKQAGVNLKAFFVNTGYGSDTLDSPQLLHDMQGVDFTNWDPPIELNNAATKAYAADLRKYAGVTSDPGFAEQNGWLTADLLVAGLKLAAPDETPANVVNKLRADKDYNPYGLLPVGEDYSTFGNGTATLAPGNCEWVTQLTGQVFKPLAGENPVCGVNIPNSDASS